MNVEEFANALRGLADQLVAGAAPSLPNVIPPTHAEGPVGPTLQTYRGAQDEPSAAWSADGKTFARDYWVVGRIGATAVSDKGVDWMPQPEAPVIDDVG